MLTGLLVACSTLHLEASANLRMYSWLALAAAGLLLGTIRLLESGRGGLVVFVSALLGLHPHYQFVHALLLCGAVSLGLAVTVPRYRSRLVPLAVLLGASLVLALPWLLFGLRVQLGHELAPGGTVVTPARAMQGYLHLLFHGVGDHGRAWRLVYLAGASLAGALALAGCLRLVRSGPPAPAALLIAGGLGLPLWIAVAALVSSRSGYDWRYLVGATPPFAALVALGATDTRCCARARTLTGGAAALVLLSLALATARHPGHEDYRSATRQVLSELRDGDAVLAVDWQPRFFPHGMGFAYYAARAGDITEIPRLEHTADYRLAGSAGQHERVSCLLRSVPSNAPFLATLRAEFSSEHSRPFGRGLHLVTFSRD